MSKQMKLYSAPMPLVPLWMMLLMPSTWIILALTHMIIVSFVLLAGLKFLGYDDIPTVWRKSILWITLYGFISYLIVNGLFFAANLSVGIVGESSNLGIWLTDYLVYPLNSNPFSSIFSILFALLALFLSGAFVYFMDKTFALRKSSLDCTMKQKLSLCLAVFSAPYITLFPSYLLFK